MVSELPRGLFPCRPKRIEQPILTRELHQIQAAGALVSLRSLRNLLLN
jgi:hypothetical protein